MSLIPPNLLDEPSPLGLSLRKSPSLQDLIQMRLSQSVKKETIANASSVVGTVEKLKASNFPATLLRIGQWEVSSAYKYHVFSLEFIWESKFLFVSTNRGTKVIWWRNVTLQNTNLCGKCWNKDLRARSRFNGQI